MKHYHYIFTGSGLAALMTVYKMAVSGKFSDKSILLIDPDTKKTNDRTWCFWKKGKGIWDEVVYRNWNTAVFANEHFKRDLDFDGYEYKMIRGLDFYNRVFAELANHPNITFTNAEVIDFADTGTHALVKTNSEIFTCNKLFNSIYNPALPASQNKYPVLQQHFIGWHVRTEEAIFDTGKPTFMDFSIPQKGNTRFMYVLPFSGNEAIVEYTLFSNGLLAKEEYEHAIKDYLGDKGAGGYEVIDTEKGSIPMTSYPFWKTNTKNILNIGSAGGWTKASTGYTFRNADKKSDALINFLSTQGDFKKFHKKNRFWFYDLLLLDILDKTNYKGSAIFSAMFKDGRAAPVFKFLDEETTFAEDIAVILKCPKKLFIKALMQRIFNL
jgi:lycopene beta-cyclase